MPVTLLMLSLMAALDGGTAQAIAPTRTRDAGPGANAGTDAGAPFTLDGGQKAVPLLPLTPPAAAIPAVAPAVAPTMAPDVKALVDRMQAFYEGTADFTARFRQDYTYKAFKRTQTSTGTVVFKKPALMRWEYLTPGKKTFVLAGDKVYAYDPEAMLLTVAAMNTNQLSASVTFLWGKGKLADEFQISKSACTACKGTLLVLTPLRPDPRFQQIRLEVDPKSAQVLRSTVVDPDGSENAITFTDLKPNTGATAETFKLEPPPGTQVQDFTKVAPKSQQSQQ